MRRHLAQHAQDDLIIRQIELKRSNRSIEWDVEEVDFLEKIVSTNLSNVLGPYGKELFEKHAFAEFFASKRGQRKPRICLDQHQARIDGLFLCLQDPCSETESHIVNYLRDYARSHLLII